MASSAVRPAIDLELAALLLEGRGQPPLALGHRALAGGEPPVLVRVLVEAALELLELAGELLFLGEDALLDRVDLALAAAGLLLEGSVARLQRALARLELAATCGAYPPRARLLSTMRRASRSAPPMRRSLEALWSRNPTASARAATTGSTIQVASIIALWFEGS